MSAAIVSINLRDWSVSGTVIAQNGRFALLSIDKAELPETTQILAPSILANECPQRILDEVAGLGSLLLVDVLERKNYIQRDRLGIGRLYWSIEDERLVCSADLRTLAREKTARKLSSEAIYLYLVHQYFPYDTTPFEGIYKVEPGSRVEIGKNSQFHVRYWRPDCGDNITDLQQFIHAASEVAQVVYQDLADSFASLGLMCSGGVDSTANAAWISMKGGRPVALTAAFEDTEFDETPYAAEASRLFGLPHEVTLIGRTALAQGRTAIQSLIEPIGDQAVLATHGLLSHCSSKGLSFDAIISGEGGDELWGVPRRFDCNALSDSDLLKPEKLAALYLGLSGCFQPEEAIRILRRRDVPPEFAAQRLGALYTQLPASDAMSQVKFGQLMTWLPENVLTKDISLFRVRGSRPLFPLIAGGFIDTYCGSTATVQAQASHLKSGLLGTYSDQLNAYLAEKPKHRFVLPMAHWISDLAQACAIELDKASVSLGEVIDISAARRFIEDCAADPEHMHRRLWTLFVLLVWIGDIE